MIEVEVEGTIYEFPDGMSQSEIKAALDKQLGTQPKAAPAPTTSVFGTPLPSEAEMMHTNAPQSVQPGSLENLDAAGRLIASGMSFGFADEFAAGMNALMGVGEGKTLSERYESNLAHERMVDKSIREREPGAALAGEIMGGVATGGALTKQGISLMAGARPTLGSMAGRGAVEGAAYGALHGAGHGEGTEGRIEGAVQGGAVGFASGGLTGAFFWPFLRNANPATLQGVKDEAQKVMATAQKAGLEVKGDVFSRGVANIATKAHAAGMDAGIHPKAAAALARLQSETGTKTLDDLVILRRVIKAAAGSLEKDERRIAMAMVKEFDSWMGRLTGADILAGNQRVAVPALKEFRTLWSRYAKGEQIMEAIDRAGVRAGQFSGSGYENALRTEFRQIAMNQKRMRMFTKQEQAAIRKVAMGGPVENVLRLLGKLAPRGVISGILAPSAAYMAGGPVVSAGLVTAGEVGRRGATAMTKASAQRALEQMLTGKGPVTLTRQQADILRSLLIAEQPLISEALPTRASAPLPVGR